MEYNKKLVFWSACIGMLLFGIVMISLGTINTFLMVKFNLDELTVGSLAALLPFGILAGSLVFGPIVDRYGYKYLIITCSLLVLIGIEAIAIAPAFVLIQVSFFIIGFGGGAINGATNALVSDISGEYKGARLSLLGVFYGIGALGMPAVLGFLSKYFAYESVITGIAIFILLPVIYFFVIKFPEPKQRQGFTLGRSIKLLKQPTLLLIGLVLFFESGMEGIANNWTTTYLQKDLDIDAKNALYALSYLIMGLTFGRLLLGWLLRKVKSYIVLVVCLILATVGTFFLIFASGYVPVVAGMLILGLGFAATFPVVLGYVGDIYSDLSGTAFSIVFVIALIGNTLINYIVGIVAQSYGIRCYLIILLFSIAFVFILLALVLRRILNQIKS